MNPAKIVERFIRDSCSPAVSKNTQVEVDLTSKKSKAGYTFEAHARGGQVRLTIYDLSEPTIRRAAYAASSVFHGNVVGKSLLSDGIRGRES